MRVPVIQGIIDRRILVNYRVDAGRPSKGSYLLRFEPKLVNGYGIAGICLIRLKDMRPEVGCLQWLACHQRMPLIASRYAGRRTDSGRKVYISHGAIRIQSSIL